MNYPTINDDSDAGETSDMEYSVPTFGADENSVSEKREAAPAAVTSRRRSRVNWGEASSISHPHPTTTSN